MRHSVAAVAQAEAWNTTNLLLLAEGAANAVFRAVGADLWMNTRGASHDLRSGGDATSLQIRAVGPTLSSMPHLTVSSVLALA